MAKKLYVGGIPYSATNEDLRAHFAQAGTVTSANIILDKMHNNRSKGFGFVEMENDDEALKAISMFHDNDFDGRTLTVNEARPMEERPKRDFDGPRERRSF
jgi:cold-inducible RNA-binding protein